MTFSRLQLVTVLIGLFLTGCLTTEKPEIVPIPDLVSPRHIDVEAAYDYLSSHPGALLVDVRTCSELQFTGVAERMDFHVPLVFMKTDWNHDADIYQMVENPDFLAQVQIELTKRKVSKDTPIFLLCRSGVPRSEVAGEILLDAGYTNVWVIEGGFNGQKQENPPEGNPARINGWKSSGYPWTWKLSPQKVWYQGKYPKMR